MGCDILGFLEIESFTPGEFDSLYDVEMHLPRHYELFAALAGVRGSLKPLFPPRGIPTGLGSHGFSKCYRPIISHTEALGYRGSWFVLEHEVGTAEVLPGTISDRWGASERGHVAFAGEVPSWLLLSELKAVLEYARIPIETLSEEYRFLLATMSTAESLFGRATRFVFCFDSV